MFLCAIDVRKRWRNDLPNDVSMHNIYTHKKLVIYTAMEGAIKSAFNVNEF